MLLKKLLNEGKPIKQLVKLFKVSDTQIFRIKRGENWANIQALN
jgi:Mor family transcriptional regulator